MKTALISSFNIVDGIRISLFWLSLRQKNIKPDLSVWLKVRALKRHQLSETEHPMPLFSGGTGRNKSRLGARGGKG